MANARRRKGLENVHSTALISHGHPGTAEYVEGTKEWIFLREICQSSESNAEQTFPFTVIGQDTSLTSPSCPTRLDEDTQYSSEHESEASSTLHSVPSLSGLHSDSTRPKSALDLGYIGSPQGCATRSTLLALGSAFFAGRNAAESTDLNIPVAASVCGMGGESIRLVRVGRQHVTRAVENVSQATIEVPCLSDQDEAWWTGRGEEVQQICFATNDWKHSMWMTARQSSSTMIFQPLYLSKPVPHRLHPSSTLKRRSGSSLLDLNPVAVIPYTRTGGHPHADVSFHPSDPSCLAIVDEHGNWSIWQLSHQLSHAETATLAHLLQFGKLYTWQGLRRPASAHPYHDSWHKICWLTHANPASSRLFVANRRTAVLYDTSREQPTEIDLCLGPIRDAQWILDIKPGKIDHGQLFVLTSTRLLVFSTAGNDWRNPNDSESCSVVCSWQHSRGHEDTTLYITVLETPGASIVLVLSRRNSLVSTFRIETAANKSSSQAKCYDPGLSGLTGLTTLPTERGDDLQILDLLFAPLQVDDSATIGRHNVEMSCFKFFVLCSNYSVIEVLLQSRDRSLRYSPDDQNATAVSCPSNVLLKRIGRIVEKSMRKPLSSFVVEDSPSLTDVYPRLQVYVKSRSHWAADVPTPRLQTAHDWQDLYNTITENQNQSADEAQVDISFALRDMCSLVETSMDTSNGVQPLSEFVAPNYRVSDIEEASGALSSLLYDLAREYKVSVRQYPSTSISQAPPANILLETYLSLVDNWISPLQSHIPDRVRVSKERLARSVATDVALSSISLHRKTEPSEFPVVHTDDPALLSSQALPTSSQAVASSSQPPTSLPTNPVTPPIHPFLTALEPYTSFSLPSATSPHLTSILSHIPDPSVPLPHPSTYSYTARTSSLTASQSQVDHRTARRAEKQAAAKARRIARYQAMSSQMQNAPEVVGTSSQFATTADHDLDMIVNSAAPMASQPRSSQSGMGLVAERGDSSQLPQGGWTATRSQTGVRKGKRRAAGF